MAAEEDVAPGSDEGFRRGGGTGSRIVDGIATALAALLTLASLAWAADLYRAAGILIWDEQFYAGMLAIALALVFLRIPARRGSARGRLPWYDALAAALGAAASCFIALNYPQMSDAIAEQPLDAIVVGVVVLVLALEGLRRTVGLTLLIVVVGFVLYALLGHLIGGQLGGRYTAPTRLLLYMTLDTNGLLGLPLAVASTIVVAFIFFGSVLRASGGSEFFTDFATAAMGGYRGGSAKIAVTASALFGSVSGSAVANVASTGVVTIPLMKQGGYADHQAGAIEAVASTGGQLMPPIMGAAAFLMAEFLQIPYAEVVLAALVPSVLYYVALFISADLEAARRDIRPLAPHEIPALRPILRAGWHFPLPFIVLIAGLFWFNLRPETAALYGAATLVATGFAIGFRGRRMTVSALARAITETGVIVLEIMMIGAAAAFIIGVLNVSGFGFALTLALVKLGSGSLALMLVVAAFTSILLGLGMPTVGVYVLLALMVAPALSEVGVPPIAAHLFVMYFGMMSMITPPVAVAAFAAATIARAEPMRTGLSAVKFGWSAYVVPFLFVLSPSLLLTGSSGEVVLAVSTAIAGVWLVSIGVTGYLLRPLGPVWRTLFAAAGLALLVPASSFEGAIWSDAAGLAVGLFLVAREFAGARREAGGARGGAGSP